MASFGALFVWELVQPISDVLESVGLLVEVVEVIDGREYGTGTSGGQEGICMAIAFSWKVLRTRIVGCNEW